MKPAATLPPALFLMGPTAIGKTDLAINLVETGWFEIISVDSGMVYRGMDIGTAKPTASELQRAPHRLMDIRDPADAYSAAEFRTDALREMAAIHAAGRIPLLVGGTMLYFKVLRDGLAQLPEADADVRQQILEEAEQHGWPHIHAQLAKVDPVSAARLQPGDAQRLQRALEVWRLTGKPLSQWHAEQQPEPLAYDLLQVALLPVDRAVLHQRIEKRFLLMLEQGFLEEVAALREQPQLHAELPALRAVGYRQAWEYLDGHYGLDELQARGIAATRQLAKRQLTWLRGLGTDVHSLYTEAMPIVRQNLLQKVCDRFKLEPDSRFF